jgi:hypothetical protein
MTNGEAEAQRAKALSARKWRMRGEEEEGAVSRYKGIGRHGPENRWASVVQIVGRDGSLHGPPRGAHTRVRKTVCHKKATRIWNGHEDPMCRHKCWRRSRREVTPDTGVSGTVRMSLTDTVPEKFSTSPRRELMSKIPEDKILENTLRRKKM